MSTIKRTIFHGRVVAIPLPSSAGTCSNSDEKATAHKPTAHQIDPNLLELGRGPLHFRPEKPFGATLSSSSLSGQPPSVASVSQDCTSASSEHITNASNTLLLDFYIYGNDKDENNPFSETLHFQMNRDSNETVRKTLQRMEMTLSKKLLTLTKSSKSKKQQNQQHPRGGDRAPTNTHETPLVSSSIWNVDAETGQLQTKWDETSLSMLSNKHVWGNVVVHQALAIQLELTPATPTTTTHTNSDPPPPVILHLLVESCPPTIVGVYTFADFESHLFVGVPLLVNVKTLYADHTVVDWHCDGECVQQDNPCYIPQPSDVGKDLAVLLRPIRKGGMIVQEPVDVRTAEAHGGNGCEDAYRFKHCIEERPENTIVNLRPTWTTRRQDNRDHDDRNNLQQQQMIRVLTFNILADQNCFDSPGHVCRTYASYLSADILRKQRRLPLVLSEILSYQADIICLQEVDESVFERLLEPILGHYNYRGFFSCKASYGTREGCATFWSLQAFEHVPIQDQKRHILRDVYTNEQRIQDDEQDWTSMADIQSLLASRPELRHVVTTVLGHILQLVPLTLKIKGATQSHVIWVANTHLYFSPFASHIRLMQMYAICHQISRELKMERNNRELNSGSGTLAPAIVICGDFNSSLTNAAGKLLIDRRVPSNFRDLKNHLHQFHCRDYESGDNNNHGTTTLNDGGSLTTDKKDDDSIDDEFPEIRLPAHFPRFQSALHETPPVTHFIPGFSGSLDHILISKNSSSNDDNEEKGIKLVSVRSAPMPTMRDVARDTAMPSPVLPSDHVSLLVELRVST